MRAYVQFLTRDTLGGECDLLGSEGVYSLDGRKSVDNWVYDAEEMAWRRRKIHKIIGFKIMMGAKFSDGKLLLKQMLPSQENVWEKEAELNKKEEKEEMKELDFSMPTNSMDNEPFNEDYHYKIHSSRVELIELDNDMRNYIITLENGVERKFRGTKSIVFEHGFVYVK